MLNASLNILKSSYSLLNVIRDVLKFIKETFNVSFYLSIILITASYVVINEVFDVYGWIIQHYRTSIFKWLFFFVLDYSAYILCCLAVFFFTTQKQFIKQKQFWLVSSGIFIFISLYRSSYLRYLIQNFEMNTDLLFFLFRIINYVDSLIVIIIPLIAFYVLYDKRHINHFYGLRAKGVNFTAYYWMFAFMAILIFFASAQASFQSYYPEVKKSHYIQVAQYFGVSQYVTLVIYEVFYMSAFVVVELLYRGLLIFTMIRFLGPYAVFPMISVYCLLHFGKPLNETISSFFGGFVLGVLALKGKNIYGGIAIHMGIALLMEVFVYIRLLN